MSPASRGAALRTWATAVHRDPAIADKFGIRTRWHPTHERTEARRGYRNGAESRLVGSRTDGSVVELVAKLTASLGDGEIARILNMKRLLTPRGLGWTMDRVQRFRAQHGIRKPKQITAEDVLTDTHQVTDFAPWRIPRAELDSEQIQKMVRILKKTGRCPAGGESPDSQESLFPGESST